MNAQMSPIARDTELGFTQNPSKNSSFEKRRIGKPEERQEGDFIDVEKGIFVEDVDECTPASVLRFGHEPNKYGDNKLTFDFAAQKCVHPLLTEGRRP